ncbi:MAG: ABC transporter substrate-binding protein [Spirochaetaceae bacterium]|jgi:iron complex transport system substrate-binding protein|nr:ABC transporter substrate-binding protein [Spirochaetaceae bacterium]
MKYCGILVFSLALFFTLGSCNRSSSASDQGAQPASAGIAAETRTVNTLRGPVSIPADPRRIADASGISDMLCIIGRKPVATSDSDAYDYTKFPSYLEDLLSGALIIGYPMADTVNVEAVLTVEPDLIIINPRQEKAYEQLQAIATTIVIEPTVNDWRGDLRMVGQLFDAGAAVESFITDYETRAREAGVAVKAANGPEATYFSFLTAGNSYYLFTGAAYGDMFYNDMGLGIPRDLPEQNSISLPTASLEGLTGISADYMVVLASPDDRAALEASSVWNSMESVKAGRVIWLPQSPYFNQAYSVYGKRLLLDELHTLLVR